MTIEGRGMKDPKVIEAFDAVLAFLQAQINR